MRASLLDRLLLRALTPVDSAWLAALRFLFGLAMCASMLRFIAYDWIDAYFVAPSFHFTYWGFSWVQALPPPLMYGLFWLLAALALCVALGLFFRFAAWGFSLGFVYVQLIDVTTYLNHYYLAALLSILLACSPAHRAFSLDAWLWPKLRSATVPAGWLGLFRFQIGVVYTFAGLAKANPDWLLHHQPLRIWLGSHTDMPLLGALFRQAWTAPVMSWAGFLFDTTIAWWLLGRRTRPFAFAAVIGFHALTSALFPIGMFPLIMIGSALVFFSPSWPRAIASGLAQALRGAGARVGALTRLATAPATRGAPAIEQRTVHRVVLALGALYCLVQLALPLRTFAYDGSVLWHEQGMRCSWRVMVREKNGSVTYVARDRVTGEVRLLHARRYLTRWQSTEMASQPDLILQLGRHLHAQLERDTGHAFELRVDARVSLNGRRSRPLIDPRVDLASMQDGLAQARWITPSPTEPPPHLTPVGRRAERTLALYPGARARD